MTFKKIMICFFILLLTFSLGCAQKPQQKPQTNNTDVNVEVDPRLAQEVKSIAETIEGVEGSAAVVVDKDISVAIKVTGLNRLRLKNIRQQVFKRISAEHKNYKVNVTSDKKLFKLLSDIEKQIKPDQKTASSDLKQRVEKINKDMRG